VEPEDLLILIPPFPWELLVEHHLLHFQHLFPASAAVEEEVLEVVH